MDEKKLIQNGNGVIPGGCLEPLNFGDVDVPITPVSQNDIDREYDVSVSKQHAIKKAKTYELAQIKFYKNNPDDMAAYRFYEQWSKKGNGINARLMVIDGIGIVKAMSREIPDVKYIMKKYPAIAAEVRAMENDVMRQEMDILKQEIRALKATQQEHSKKFEDIISWAYEPVNYVIQKLVQMKIIKPNTKEKLTDGN